MRFVWRICNIVNNFMVYTTTTEGVMLYYGHEIISCWAKGYDEVVT